MHSEQKADFCNFLKVALCTGLHLQAHHVTSPREMLEVIMTFFRRVMNDALETAALILKKPAEIMPLATVSNSSTSET